MNVNAPKINEAYNFEYSSILFIIAIFHKQCGIHRYINYSTTIWNLQFHRRVRRGFRTSSTRLVQSYTIKLIIHSYW